MTENIHFNYIFDYIKNEGVIFDKDEFVFQMQSHPDYPFLLSITDTFTFFKIDNGAFKLEFSEIKLLPNDFITLLKEGNSKPQLVYIKKKEKKYQIIKGNEVFEIDEIILKEKWLGIVLLVEKSESKEAVVINNEDKISTFFLLLFSVMLIIVLFFLSKDVSSLLYLIFPALGLIFSIVALKDLFGVKSKILNQLCNITVSTSCESVISSKRWNVFKIVNFSDLSIIFFAFQFYGFLVFNLTGSVKEYFYLQKIIHFAIIPVIFISFYYQKFIEKKWCPICLVISGIILSEMFYLFLIKSDIHNFSINAVLVFGFTFMHIVFVWIFLKKLLTKQKELKEFYIKSRRFQRNYKLFKNSLLSTEKININPINFINLGDPNSRIKISLITSPFCSYCKDVHKIIDSILETHEKKIQVKLIFKTNFELDSEEVKMFFRNLLSIYISKGEEAFKTKLADFFEYNKIDERNLLQKKQLNIEKLDVFYSNMNIWCLKNDINFTPNIFINGYQYPSFYEIEDLKYFIADLIEDYSV